MDDRPKQWLEYATMAIGVLAVLAPLAGVSFLVGYLDNFDVVAFHVVGLEDIAIASLLAFSLIAAILTLWLCAASLTFAIAPRLGVLNATAAAAALLAGVLLALSLIYDAFVPQREHLNAFSYAYAAVAALSILAVVVWLVRGVTRTKEAHLRMAALSVLVPVLLLVGLVKLPYDLGMTASFVAWYEANSLTRRGDETSGSCAVMWAGSRARVASCDNTGVVVTFTADGQEYVAQ